MEQSLKKPEKLFFKIDLHEQYTARMCEAPPLYYI